MASNYDSSKDVMLKLFEMKQEGDKSLMFSIYSYNGGKAKLQMTRTYAKKDGSTGYASVGRVSVEELNFLKDNMDEIIKIMSFDETK